MRCGYYYVTGRYGEYLNKVAFTNLYHAWCHMAYESTAPQSVWLPQMVADIQRAIASGKEVVLALNMQVKIDATDAAVRNVLQAVKPFWSKIISIEAADEPSWTQLVTTSKVKRVKQLVAQAGLSSKPVYVVYTDDQILKKNAFKSPALDAVGVETYIDYIAGESAPAAQTRMTTNLDSLLARIPIGKKIVLIGMAYDRNLKAEPDKGWANPKTLVAVQAPYFKIARRLDSQKRLISLNLFSFGRQGGTCEKPALKREHKRLLA